MCALFHGRTQNSFGVDAVATLSDVCDGVTLDRFVGQLELVYNGIAPWARKLLQQLRSCGGSECDPRAVGRGRIADVSKHEVRVRSELGRVGHD